MTENNRLRENSCAFTGHRAAKLPWGNDEQDPACLKLKDRINDAIEAAYHSGITHFICGMATGCDMYFCEAVMRLRNCHPEITIEAAIPWEGQSSSWSEELKKRYFRLVSECDYQTLVQTQYTHDCMMRRNKYMIDNASILIACYDGKQGGTQSTMLYAIRQKVNIIEISI